LNADLLVSVWANPGQRPNINARQWEALIGQARQARLLARLANHCVDKSWLDGLPDVPRRHLEGALRLADRQQHEVRWEIDRITQATRDMDVPIVLLKGAAYLIAELPAAKGRVFSDIDIMVPRSQIDAVEISLLGAGWISDERDPYNQRYYRQWMHEVPPLRHIQRHTYIDLHHTITPPTSRFHVDGDKLMSRAIEVRGSPGFLVLAPMDMVLHSAVHLFQEGEFGHGLRDLLDLNDLLQHFSSTMPDFWREMLNRTTELKLQIPLFHALFHLQRLLGTTAPKALTDQVHALGPSIASRTMMAWVLGLALRPMHPSCDTYWTKLARWLLYVRAHALRMPLHLVVPHLARKAWMRRFPDEKTKTQ